MGNTVSKNAFAGFPYQEWVYRNLVFKMDLNKKIVKINAEINREDSTVKTNFDDIFLEDIEKNKFYIQVKNLQNFKISDVEIEDSTIKIKGQKHIKFNKFETNIIIINSNFECNDEILGMKAKIIDPIYFIPLTHENYENQVGKYYDIKRKDSINNLIENRIYNRKFQFCINDLPPLKVYPVKLNKKTILLRDISEYENIDYGVHWCIGEPGIGKSHLVKEIMEKVENSIVYRLHTDNTDLFIDDRLNFSSFLKDVSYNLFKTPEFKTDDQIIKKLENIDKILIIDGLDHVENYKPTDFEKFLNFIEKLDKTKTLIFSRPLRKFSNYKNMKKIRKWSKDETIFYLKEEYGFEGVVEEIYEVTDGYPIITYYIAEHLKAGGSLSDYPKPINSINEYYDNITSNINFKNSLKLFLTIPSYILFEEIPKLLDKDMSDILLDFIKVYPYLFNRELNRISLFHDSFANYLRFSYKQNFIALEKIKRSILSKNIEYLSRFSSIDFDDDFIKDVLRLYCNFSTFKELISNYDFESIKQFYISLKNTLAKFENVLDIYQYYSIALITLILERHDYHNVPELFYNIFHYFDNNNIDEKNIYSNGVLWSLYVYYKTSDIYLYEKLLETEFHDTKELIDDLDEKWEEEKLWAFDYENTNPIEETKIREYIIETQDHELFEDYLAYIYIKGLKYSEYYTLIYHYINHTFKKYHEEYFNEVCEEFGFLNFKKKILKNTKIKIFERGYLEEENIFLNQDLNEFMRCLSPKLSCDIYGYLIGYIRLYNHLNKNFSFEEIFRYLNMYYFRKDYSVFNLSNALITFEKHQCISECDSVRLIKNAMQKSEKGIRSLLSDYVNQKPPQFTEKIDKNWNELEIYINDLDHERINYISIEKILYDLRYVISSYTSYYDIEELLKSKYKKHIISILKLDNITVTNVPKELSDIFEKNNINFEIKILEKEKEINERNYLLKNDFEELKNNSVDHLTLSKYVDGFNFCLPFIEFFEIYNPNTLNNDCLKMIHNALSTKERYFNKYLANWSLCLGNIPYLLDMVNYDVQWEQLFKLLISFLEESSIYLY